MKLPVIIRKTVDAKYLDVYVAVRFGEEDMPNDAPLRDGDMWNALIDIDEGRIVNWPQGKSLNIESMKVCDQGSYVLLDADREEVGRLEESYVPTSLLPGGDDDYLCLNIDESGKITNWLKRPSLVNFVID